MIIDLLRFGIIWTKQIDDCLYDVSTISSGDWRICHNHSVQVAECFLSGLGGYYTSRDEED